MYRLRPAEIYPPGRLPPENCQKMQKKIGHGLLPWVKVILKKKCSQMKIVPKEKCFPRLISYPRIFFCETNSANTLDWFFNWAVRIWYKNSPTSIESSVRLEKVLHFVFSSLSPERIVATWHHTLHYKMFIALYYDDLVSPLLDKKKTVYGLAFLKIVWVEIQCTSPLETLVREQ